MKMNDNLRGYYISFYGNSSSMIGIVKKYVSKKYPELEKGEKELYTIKLKGKKIIDKYEMTGFGSGHAVTYLTAIDVWIDNPIIGNGIKSFRIKCLTKLHLPNRVCASHPHNYYLELLNDTGLLGTLLLICAIFYLITNKFLNFKYYEKNEKLLFICLLMIIVAEFFPLRSSGSFFSTANSSFIFLILGMLNGLEKIKE
jgi:hypothetical protein